MPNGNNDDIGNKIDDVLSYPILTEAIRYPGTPRPGTSGTAGSSQYGQIVESTLRDILGWRVNNNDPKGFVAAISQSFHLSQVEGHTEWKWTPHTYAIDADLGAVTGAQAALYSRAKAALNQALPLLDGLQTLLAASDDQEIEALSSIVRSSMTGLVSELGEEGGPILSRIDQYFELLLGTKSSSNLKDPEKVGGQLGRLRDAFGLIRQNVNTIAEEQNLTNFLIMIDHVNSLKLTWDSQKHFFDRQGTDVFLGTQMVLLSRTLAVVAESVREAYFAMDSVFLGPAERQVTKLDLGIGSPIFIGELLNWVERFALEEGPRLLKEGGKDGVIHAFGPTVNKLSNLVEAAANVARLGSANPTPGFHTPRVQRAIEELGAHLKTTSSLASKIKREARPSITAVDPEELIKGETVKVTINGADFQFGATVRLNRSGNSDDEILPSKVLFVDKAEIKATFDLTDDIVGNPWTVVVINPDGQYDTLKRAIRINAPVELLPPPPEATIIGFLPPELRTEDDQELTITGTNLDPADITVTLISTKSNPFSILGTVVLSRSSSTKIAAKFDLSNVSPTTGVMVVVENPGEYTLVPQARLTIVSSNTVTSKSASAAKSRKK
jgi:hypothetical protein